MLGEIKMKLNKWLIPKLCLLLLSTLFLSSCEPDKNLTFNLSENKIIVLKTSVKDRNLSVKPIDKGQIAIGAFEYNTDDYSGLIDLLGVIVKFSNNTDQDVYLHPNDIIVKTADGYYPQQIDISYYSKQLESYALFNLEQASQMQVRQGLEIETHAIEGRIEDVTHVSPNYMHTVPITPYNPMRYDISRSYGEIKYGLGHYYSGSLTEEQRIQVKGQTSKTYISQTSNERDEWRKSSAMSQANALKAASLQFQNEYVPRVLDKPMLIRAHSWNYYYSFYEKPFSFPIHIMYKNTLFTINQ
ncbi:hypothetical protein ACFL96_18305 [Thermoproteota archaeon]